MKTEQRKWTEARGWTPAAPGPVAKSCALVLGFGAPDVLRKEDLVATVRRDYPRARIFVGDNPEGARAGLMMANFDRLIDGAKGAAQASHAVIGSEPPDPAILISCVGRKLVLEQRIEEEVEAVREVLGVSTTLAGFYSYGEILPFTPGAKCELHNQKMTITALSER